MVWLVCIGLIWIFMHLFNLYSSLHDFLYIQGVSGISYKDTEIEELQIDQVTDDWTPPNSKLLRTKVHPLLNSSFIEMESVIVEDNAETELDKARLEKENIDFNNTRTESHITAKSVLDNKNVEVDHMTDHVYHKKYNDEAEIQKQPGIEKSECLI